MFLRRLIGVDGVPGSAGAGIVDQIDRGKLDQTSLIDKRERVVQYIAPYNNLGSGMSPRHFVVDGVDGDDIVIGDMSFFMQDKRIVDDILFFSKTEFSGIVMES